MERKLSKVRSISQIVENTKEFIEKRSTGEIKSLRVKSEKINQCFMDGFDWNRIITLAGMSGAGKSMLYKQWIREFLEINSDQKFRVLNFQLEMLATDEVARDVSAEIGLTVKQIYSANHKLSQQQKDQILNVLEKIKDAPIDYVETSVSVQEFEEIVVSYFKANNLLDSKEGVIVALDHTLLVSGEGEEKDTLDKFYQTLIKLKKRIYDAGGKVLFLIVSQLNRNITSPERIANPSLHYPNKNDLHGSSAVYNGSDYVIITHKPSIIDGIGNFYGPPRKSHPRGLPVFTDDGAAMVYLHVIKERYGETKIIPMVDDFKQSRIVEYK